MLIELHIRNLALIKSADLEFNKGLSIISGETGAGKSILIDSINLALGQKVNKDIIRTGADSAYIELIFKVDDAFKIEKLKELDVYPTEDELIIINRRITETKSILKLNDESVTSSKLKKLAEILIDIHSQHEHQSLMNNIKQLELIDAMADKEVSDLKGLIKENLGKYKEIDKLLMKYSDEAALDRELDLLKYEVEEIDRAHLIVDEEEMLKSEFKRLKNISKISDALNICRDIDLEDSLSVCNKALADVVDFDDRLADIQSQFVDIESLIYEAWRNISDYQDNLEFDEERFDIITNRLDEIRRLEAKYKDNVENILIKQEEKKKSIESLENLKNQKQNLLKEKDNIEIELNRLSLALSDTRKKAASFIVQRIEKELLDLNFLGVKFDIRFTKSSDYTLNGIDVIEFLISTNPGESLKPLKDIASGGELSRIMLAFKTVLAQLDDVSTLIFDEIDTGISGRTAQKVSEKLAGLAKTHQIICITHLPQIAAMADNHMLIEKSTDGKETVTSIKSIYETEIVEEIARLIGGSEITQVVFDTAKEMKLLANQTKNKY